MATTAPNASTGTRRAAETATRRPNLARPPSPGPFRRLPRMSNRGEGASFIPALRFRALTPLFDPFMAIILPDGEIKRRLLARVHLSDTARILDFGCGTATLTLLVKRRFPGARVRGLDVDEEILAKARRKAEADEADVGLDHFDGGRFPYPDCSFDGVVTCFVLHHLNDREKGAALREIHRVLAPGGHLYVADFDRARTATRQAAFAVARLLDGFPNTRANAHGRLQAMIKEAGFSEVREAARLPVAMGEVAFIEGSKNDPQ